MALVIAQRPGFERPGDCRGRGANDRGLVEDFPEGLEYRIVYNPTVFVRESINSVFHTLFEAVILVVIVVLVFLQSWRATLIPLIAIPVSLIGTFAAMAVFGFSLNMLSLFGLVLAIGIVVDDAIVVVENVERHIAAGLKPREAAHKAMDEVTGAVIAIAAGLSAVFVPTAFISGISGQFYRQFALTIAVATLISAFNSLTLSPALCAILLQPHGARKDWFGRVWDFALGWFFRIFNRSFEATSSIYSRTVGWLLRRVVLAVVVYLLLIGITWYGFRTVPTGFIPGQDRRYLITVVQLPDGASLERTDEVVRRATKMMLDTPGVNFAVSFVGFSGATRANSANAGAIFVGPKPFVEGADDDWNAKPIAGDPAGQAVDDCRRRHLRDSAAAGSRPRHGRRHQVHRSRSRRAWSPRPARGDRRFGGRRAKRSCARRAYSRPIEPRRRSCMPISIARRPTCSMCRWPISSKRCR